VFVFVRFLREEVKREGKRG